MIKKDCLNCSKSFCTDDENGKPILVCIEHDNDVVDEKQPACNDYNCDEGVVMTELMVHGV